jgi:dienelactone hydrolase
VCESIASLGFVVVGLSQFNPKKSACTHEYQDQLHALAGSKADPSLHPALAHVDWSRAGVIGHSMGGFSSSMAAATPAHVAKFNLKAAVLSHGAVDQFQTCKNSSADNQCPNGCGVSAFPMTGGAAKCTCCTGPSPGTPNITIPVMFTTGSADSTVEASFLYKAFQACPARPRVYVNTAGQYHTTKGEQGFDAHFLACHVAGNQTSCARVYGTGPTDLCQARKRVKCQIDRSAAGWRPRRAKGGGQGVPG